MNATDRMDANVSRDSTFQPSDRLHEMQKELSSRSLTTFVLENLIYSCGELLTILGNALVLFIILRNQTLRRNVTNMMIVSLSISGFFSGLVVVPMSHVVLLTSKWPFSDDVCQFQGFMTVFLGTSSLLTLAIISLSRFYSVVKNGKYRVYFTIEKTIAIIILTWILAISAPTLYLLSGYSYIFIPAKLICYIPVKTSWFLLLLAGFYVGLPSLIVMSCYLKIFLVVRKHKANFFATTRSSTSNVQEINITLMMFVIVLCFSMCWFPVLLIELIDITRGTWSQSRAVYMVFTMLGGLSNALNPIIYGIMNSTLRREFVNLFTCNGVCQPSERRYRTRSNTVVCDQKVELQYR